jgi:rhodanese-related sulfurtransferase
MYANKTISALLFFFCVSLVASQTIAADILDRTEVVKNLSAQESAKVLKQDNAIVIIDVRTKKEYAAGHIPNAIHIDFYDQSLEEQLKRLDRQTQYLIYCRSGRRSDKTLSIMKDLGFSNLLHLENGILEWQQYQMPLEK